MSIPLDRLYHYIEALAQQVWGCDVVIYRFYPHGSKKLEDLTAIRTNNLTMQFISPKFYCNDQEPLDFDRYEEEINQNMPAIYRALERLAPDFDFKWNTQNFRKPDSCCYDLAMLIHSEQRSENLEKYRQSNFVDVFYWSHAVIARDWFRFAEHERFLLPSQKSQDSKRFLVYNRAWCGTREYRLGFLDRVIENNLESQVRTTCNPVDPEVGHHYRDHQFRNPAWRPQHRPEDFFPSQNIPSSYSADYQGDDYASTDWEVVLETLFDDDRLHLTEKILRPIACQQPFLAMATHGSLEYLRRYGFQTFNSVIDESYDTIADPSLRMQAVINEMTKISQWSESERRNNLARLDPIVKHNRQRFFSPEFQAQIEQELLQNLRSAYQDFENRETGRIGIERRKRWYQHPELRKIMNGTTDIDILRVPRQDIMKIISTSRRYYNRYLQRQAQSGDGK